MPLTPEQKRMALLAEGSDPQLFDIDDNTLETIPRVATKQVQPTLPSLTGAPNQTQMPPHATKEFGKLETFGRNAASGVIPALAGAGAWAGAATLAPETFGLSFLVPLAASVAAGWGTHKLQDMALEQTDTGKQFVADTAAASAQNPVSATLGYIASALPTMRPSISMLKDAGRGALAGDVLNPAMKNVALGTALGTGAGLYQEYKDPAELNVSRLLANIGGGALMNKPADNALARFVGIHPYQRPELYGRPEGVLPEGDVPVAAQPKIVEETPVASDAMYTREPRVPKYKVNPDSIDRSVTGGKAKTDAMAKYKESEIGNEADIARMEGEGAQPISTEEQKIAAGLKKIKEGDIKYSQEEGQGNSTDEYGQFAQEAIGQGRLNKSNQQLADKIGAKLEILPSETKTFDSSNGDGKKVYGEANISTGEAKITQTKPDTGFHELTGHLLFENLPTKLQKRYLRGVRDSENFKKWDAANGGKGEREYLAQATGEHDLKRITQKDASLWKDLKSWFKTHVSGNATDEDIVRQLSNRAYYGKGGEVTSKEGGAVVSQEYKQAPVIYKGYQEGSPSGKIKGFHLYDLKENVSPTLVKGSTVSEAQLNKEGYSGKHTNPPEEIKSQEADQTPTGINKKQPTDDSKKGFAKFLEASFDKVERVSKPLAQAFRNFASRKDEHLGLRNTALSDLNKFSTEKVAKVVDAHDKFYRGETQTEPIFSGDEAKISDLLKNYYGKVADIRREAKLTIDGREAGKNPYYVPHQLNEQTLHTLINRAGSPEAMAIRNKIAKHMADNSKGSITYEAAKKDVTEYINALGGERNNYKSINFGAIRKAAGYGLPKDLRELDPFKSLEKYGRRASADLALFQELESKPEIAAMLKIPDPRTGKIPELPEIDEQMIHASPEVKEAMKWVMNNFVSSSENPKITSFVRLVNNSLLGTATGLRDTASIINNTLPYVHNVSGARDVIRGIGDFQKNWRKSLETGARQPNLDRSAFNDIVESPDRVTKTIQTVADGLRKWQGRELIENVNRTLTFGMGRQLAKGWIAGAKNGDATSKKFLERFNTLVEGDVTKLPSGDKLEATVDKIAKNFTDAHQGTYDGRGLPTWTQEGNFAPFVALQKWSIEKSNTIYKDVYKPFVSGENRLPMLTYTLGSVLTGAAIQELNKLLTNRKSGEATVKEALWSRDPKHIAAEVATLMQLGSYLGIVGDSIKTVSDITLKGKTPRNVVSFPAATAGADFAEKVSDFSEAIQQGEDPLETLKSFMVDIGTHNIQGLRMLMNRYDAEGAERSDKFRDVRVFKELSGEPVGDIGKANKYLNASSRKFKQTGDPVEAVNEMPKLLEQFQKKVTENPEKALRFLRSLKANNYQTVPNPQESPLEFSKFYNFLVETQGAEEARKRIEDYVRQTEVNKAKTKMVP